MVEPQLNAWYDNNGDSLRVIEGLGVEGDAHAGVTVQHLSRVRKAYSIPDSEAFDVCRTLLKAEGIMAGTSSGTLLAAISRSDGAVKQLQLRGVRNLAKLMPEGLR